jgi:Flp pilus assembly secretin CpaC
MAYSLARGASVLGYGRALACALGVAVFGLPAKVSAADIDVIVDQAKLVKLPDRVATIVIGNPLIADANVQTGGLMVITGKGYGRTNLIALDRAGAVLLEKTIEVRGPRAGIVVVYRGVERESYSCTPYCDRRITLGDSPTYFDAVIAQTATRSGQAQAGVASGSK